jgi:hypothetical protein
LQPSYSSKQARLNQPFQRLFHFFINTFPAPLPSRRKSAPLSSYRPQKRTSSRPPPPRNCTSPRPTTTTGCPIHAALLRHGWEEPSGCPILDAQFHRAAGWGKAHGEPSRANKTTPRNRSRGRPYASLIAWGFRRGTQTAPTHSGLADTPLSSLSTHSTIFYPSKSSPTGRRFGALSRSRTSTCEDRPQKPTNPEMAPPGAFFPTTSTPHRDVPRGNIPTVPHQNLCKSCKSSHSSS